MTNIQVTNKAESKNLFQGLRQNFVVSGSLQLSFMLLTASVFKLTVYSVGT